MKNIICLLTYCFFAPLLLAQTIIKLEKEGGVFNIPCKVNGQSLTFIFDTGASDVLISLEEAKKLSAGGFLKKTDFLLETEKYQTASGEIIENAIVYIRELEIGGLMLTNVKASIALSQGGSLLLGQSALSKFGEFTFNYEKNTLTINSNSNVDMQKKIEEAKKKIISSGQPITDQFIFNIEKAQRLYKNLQLLNVSLDFEVVNIIKSSDGNGTSLTFIYDITNNSEIDYQYIEYWGVNTYINIDVYTEDGKTYSSNAMMLNLLSHKTGTSPNIQINIRNKIPKYYRIYPTIQNSVF